MTAADREVFEREAKRALRDKPNGEAGKPIPAPSFYTEAELAGLDLPMPQFVIDGILPVGLAIISAPPKLGKTWLNFGAGRAVTSGTLFGGSRKVRKGPALMLDLEGNRRRAQKRSAVLRCGGVPSPDFHITHLWPPMQAGGLELLEQAITTKGAVLVIIDIWACFRPPRPKNADPYQHDHESAKLVQEMAHRTGCAVILTYHNRKAEAADWTAEVSGSAGLTAACDTIISISRKRGACDAVMKVTGRDLDEQELGLSFKDGVWTILGDAAELAMNANRRAIYDCLLMAGKAMGPRDVAKETDVNINTVKSLLGRMLRDGTVSNIDGRYRPREVAP